MFLIPYLYKNKEANYPIHLFYVFLQRGILLLQMDETEIDSFLEENEFYYTKKTIIENHCYIEIDPIKTNINSFYTYIENSDAECWRRFIMIGNDSEDFLHVNNTNPEFIRPILTNILGLSSYQTSFKT